MAVLYPTGSVFLHIPKKKVVFNFGLPKKEGGVRVESK